MAQQIGFMIGGSDWLEADTWHSTLYLACKLSGILTFA
jgi:hypothetical protein